jgi:hypothetical protein
MRGAVWWWRSSSSSTGTSECPFVADAEDLEDDDSDPIDLPPADGFKPASREYQPLKKQRQHLDWTTHIIPSLMPVYLCLMRETDCLCNCPSFVDPNCACPSVRTVSVTCVYFQHEHPHLTLLLCDTTKKELYFSADRFRWIFMTKDNEVVFNEDFYLLYSTK